MEDLAAQYTFEENMQVGDEILVRWTNSHNQYEGKGRVMSIHRTKVRVELIMAPEPYEVGQDIRVPTSGQPLWSRNNRAMPVPPLPDDEEKPNQTFPYP